MQKIFLKLPIILLLLLLSNELMSQSMDTLRVMTYNLLNYRNNTITGCSNTNNNPTTKEGGLNTIISHVLPDILVCNEIGTSDPAASFRISQNALNQNGRNYYQFTTMQKGQRQIINGSSTGNMIYWDSRKLELYDNDFIEFDPFNRALVRVIDHYTLYYKDPNLSVHADTTFLHIFIAHLKAGNTTSDQNERDWATNAVMAYLDSNNIDGNILLGGDLNLYRSNENAYQNMLNYSLSSLRFYDPINVPGSWTNNSPYAIVHTQSTRTTGGCGATGGLDDRFDFILASDEIMNGTDSVQYISGSYEAVGQDGQHFNAAVSSGTNNSAPTAVIQALEAVSDHLPVIMDLEIRLPATTSIKKVKQHSNYIFNNPIEDFLSVSFKDDKQVRTVQLIDMSGRILLEKQAENKGRIKLDCSDFKRGVYFLKVVENHNTYSIQKLIKI